MSQQPSDYLILEHRLSLWELSKKLESFRKMRWSFKVPNEDILDYLEGNVQTLNWISVTNM